MSNVTIGMLCLVMSVLHLAVDEDPSLVVAVAMAVLGACTVVAGLYDAVWRFCARWREYCECRRGIRMTRLKVCVDFVTQPAPRSSQAIRPSARACDCCRRAAAGGSQRIEPSKGYVPGGVCERPVGLCRMAAFRDDGGCYAPEFLNFSRPTMLLGCAAIALILASLAVYNVLSGAFAGHAVPAPDLVYEECGPLSHLVYYLSGDPCHR
jgi:hypothetical protein